MRTTTLRGAGLDRLACRRCVDWLRRATAASAQAQEPTAPTAVAPEQLQAAIDKLGDLDYATRMAAVAHRPADRRQPGGAGAAAVRWTSTPTATCAIARSCC